MNKRIGVFSDLHCGHVAGLTAPEYWVNKKSNPGLHAMQRECWSWFAAAVKRSGPFDAAFWMGDMIDGKNTKEGGCGLFVADRKIQSDIAIAAVNHVNAPKNHFVYGTPYHVGAEERWEEVIASACCSPIHTHGWVDVNGVVFDLKHKIGASSVPHGRFTAAAREQLWNALWAEGERQPKADILLRGHVHYHSACGQTGRWWAMTCPALQAAATHYGATQCSGLVDYGFLIFDITERGDYSWRIERADLQTEKATAVKL